VALGAILGALGSRGRDKVTLLASPRLVALGAWLEQLLAESTGKGGKGLIPVDREGPAPPEAYGDDRLFVRIGCETDPDPGLDASASAFARAGHPVIRISVGDIGDLGQEFFRWEFATAVAGSILGINPFDQPDVEASKIATRKLTDEYERTGALPREEPLLRIGDVALHADPANARALRAAAVEPSLAATIRAHLGRLGERDYLAILAYIESDEASLEILQAIRHAVRDATGAATCLGFGPRYLHSTGQAYKGGPDSGVFLQITCDEESDVPVPGRKVTFGVVKAAQARGDLEVLGQRGRRSLRAHLGPDVGRGLAELRAAVFTALARGGRRA
jgi:transaldolase/glucose-6-phosphate isomerase